MAFDVRIWEVGGKWRASVDWQGERLFGEADTPALAMVELGHYWEDRARKENDNVTLARLLVDHPKQE